MNGDIIKYQVKRELSPAGSMYGKTEKLTGNLDSKDEAIKIAKNYKNAYVVEKVYTSQANLERDFTLTERVCYAPWITGGWL